MDALWLHLAPISSLKPQKPALVPRLWSPGTDGHHLATCTELEKEPTMPRTATNALGVHNNGIIE